MITYGIELVLKRTVKAVTTTNHVAVPASKDGGLETGDRIEAGLALDHWAVTFPQHDFKLIQLTRVTLETRPATTKGNE